MHNSEFLQQGVELAKQHRASMTGVYMYYGVGINAAGELSAPSVADMHTYTGPFLDLGLTASVALGIQQQAVQAGTWRNTSAIQDLVQLAVNTNISSYMIDYEPSTNITLAHAQAYADFMRELASGLHAAANASGSLYPQLDMCVSSWGILTRFDLYHATGVDRMMNMASTYFGKDISQNEHWVQQELSQGVTRQQLVGLVIMPTLINPDSQPLDHSIYLFVILVHLVLVFELGCWNWHNDQLVEVGLQLDTGFFRHLHGLAANRRSRHRKCGHLESRY